MVRYSMDCTRAFIRELDQLADDLGGLSRVEVFRRALALLKTVTRDTHNQPDKRLVVLNENDEIEKIYLVR